MDKDQIDELVALGTDPRSIARVQTLAKELMRQSGSGYTLKLACAATLSCFLNEAGIPVAKTVGAGELARRLREKRGWVRVDVGKQRAGDVGVTYDRDQTRAGADHVYLVVERLDADLMYIADNQVEGRRHRRTASGRAVPGKTSAKTDTEYFLRAPSGDNLLLASTKGLFDDELPDVDTNGLREPYDDEGLLVGFAEAAEQ